MIRKWANVLMMHLFFGEMWVWFSLSNMASACQCLYVCIAIERFSLHWIIAHDMKIGESNEQSYDDVVKKYRESIESKRRQVHAKNSLTFCFVLDDDFSSYFFLFLPFLKWNNEEQAKEDKHKFKRIQWNEIHHWENVR